MSGTTDKIKGRVKEAVGVVTGNQRLKDEGRIDQATGKVKKTVERVIDKAGGCGGCIAATRALAASDWLIVPGAIGGAWRSVAEPHRRPVSDDLPMPF